MSMFHKSTDTEPVNAEKTASMPELIPLSHLALDFGGVPDEGWLSFLARRGVAIVPDSLGRDAIGFDAARRLFDEQREIVLRKAALLRVAEQAAVEQDQAMRAALGMVCLLMRFLMACRMPKRLHPLSLTVLQLGLGRGGHR